MRRIRALLVRIAGLGQRRRTEEEFDAELTSHLELHIADNVRAGMTPSEARRDALMKLGGVDQTRERCRDRRGLPLIEAFAMDIRYAVRMLIRDRRVTVAAIVAVALGIGSSGAVFTIVNGVLFHGLPFSEPERLVWLDTEDSRGRSLGVSLQDFEDWRHGSRTLAGMALAFSPGFGLAIDGAPPVSYPGGYLSAAGFEIVGQKAAFGRTILPADDRPGAAPVVVLSDAVWKDQFAADPAVLGKSVRVNGIPMAVIGVMPQGFDFPSGNRLWVPSAQVPPALLRRGRAARFFVAYGRLAPGATLAEARSELLTTSTSLAQEFQDTNKDTTAALTPFLERAVDPQIRTLSWTLIGAVAFVLLVACSNVANLLLARASKRAREVALRMSLGATRGRIVRQLLTESVLLSLAGGTVGLGLAVGIVDWVDRNTRQIGRPAWMVFTVDARVLAFFAVVCVLTGILFGLAPALHTSRASESDVLKPEGRTLTDGIRARKWTAALVVSQLALTLVLLSSAGLMVRSFLNLYRMDVGFDSSRILTMRLVLPARKYPTFDLVQTFLRRVDERLNAAASVAAASTATSLPLFATDWRQLAIDGAPASTGDAPPGVITLSAGPRYFDVLGVHLLRGRGFDDADGTPGHEAAVVNEPFAKRYFPSGDALGKRIRLSDNSRPGSPAPWATIVGIAPAIRQRSIQDAPAPDPAVYIPNIQNATHRNGTMVMVRATQAPAALVATLRDEIFALDPDLPLGSVDTMDDLLAQNRWRMRVAAAMFGIAAALALLLAAVGLYGVTAYSVAQRTREIGVRIALGAASRDIAYLVGRRIAWQLGIGVAIGAAGALIVGEGVKSVLVETKPLDPVTLVTTMGILIATAVVACLLPTRRAMALDPIAAMRGD